MYVHVRTYEHMLTTLKVDATNVCVCSPFVTRSEDHDHHMTVFPSMRPAGRHEAVTLKVRFTCSALQYNLKYMNLEPV